MLKLEEAKSLKNECAERADLNADLEECDQMLKLEEAKVVHAQNEAAQMKQELERRVAEKDEEIENVRKTYHKKLEAMQASIQEAEVKAKTELGRLKKKFDSDFAEMQRSFDQAKREKMELEQQLEEEVRQKNEFYDKLNMQERKNVTLAADNEDLRSNLDRVGK